MRVRINKITVMDNKNHGHLKNLLNEKGIFSLGRAFFSCEGVLIIACIFKPFDAGVLGVKGHNAVAEQDFHAIKINRKEKYITVATASGNFLSFEIL